jgi:hypothetical protein
MNKISVSPMTYKCDDEYIVESFIVIINEIHSLEYYCIEHEDDYDYRIKEPEDVLDWIASNVDDIIDDIISNKRVKPKRIINRRSVVRSAKRMINDIYECFLESYADSIEPEILW